MEARVQQNDFANCYSIDKYTAYGDGMQILVGSFREEHKKYTGLCEYAQDSYGQPQWFLVVADADNDSVCSRTRCRCPYQVNKMEYPFVGDFLYFIC